MKPRYLLPSLPYLQIQLPLSWHTTIVQFLIALGLVILYFSSHLNPFPFLSIWSLIVSLLQLWKLFNLKYTALFHACIYPAICFFLSLTFCYHSVTSSYTGRERNNIYMVILFHKTLKPFDEGIYIW